MSTCPHCGADLTYHGSDAAEFHLRACGDRARLRSTTPPRRPSETQARDESGRPVPGTSEREVLDEIRGDGGRAVFFTSGGAASFEKGQHHACVQVAKHGLHSSEGAATLAKLAEARVAVPEDVKAWLESLDQEWRRRMNRS